MITHNDLEVLARTLWGEARGERTVGMVAVAWTIRNRVDMDLNHDGKPDWWGEGYTGVCKAPYQFSCWLPNDPNYPYMAGTKQIPSTEMALATAAAQSVVTGVVSDPTRGATHYHATSIKPPKWTVNAKHTTTIGRHAFYKDVK